MYNEAQKERYLRIVDSEYSKEYHANLKSLFNTCSPMEELYGKDLSLFSHEEINGLYMHIRYADVWTYSNANGRLSGYTAWCCSQNLVYDGCNHFTEFQLSDFEQYINKRLESMRYLTTDAVYSFVDEIENPRDKFLVLAIFEIGKSTNFQDIYQMRLSDIDPETLKVKLTSGKTVSISFKLYSIACEADSLEEYYAEGSSKPKKFVPSEYIFKKVNTLTSDSSDMTQWNKITARLIKTMVDRYGLYKGVNTTSLAISGQLEMVRKIARDHGCSKQKAIFEYFDLLREQYYMSPDDPARFYKKYKAYL